MDFRDDLKFYAKVAQRKLGYVAGQVELTSECFQKCLACDSWRADAKGEIKGMWGLGKFLSFLWELDAMPTFEHLSLTGGDPQRWPEIDYFLKSQRDFYRFSFQMNTALAKEPGSLDDYRTKLQRLRVSLDGVTPDTYRRMRGVRTDPEEIVDRMDRLAHPMLATNTCVTDVNIDEVPAIVARLNEMKNPPRKAMFLAVLDFEVGSEFWRKYAKLKEIKSPRVPTSFSEDVEWVRGFTAGPESSRIPCYAGGLTFHIKCDGDVYPCCLVGGEAIKTRKEMAIGNVFNEPLSAIHSRYAPGLHYADKEGACVKVCQWKQLQVNMLGHEASKTTLAMP